MGNSVTYGDKCTNVEDLKLIRRLNLIAGKRVFAVGDIHGEITKLNDKLVEVGFDKENDLLVSVGDLVDRGEDSLACLSLIQDEPWFHAVRGNHEELMIGSVIHKDANFKECWLQNGGQWYYDLNQEDRMYADDLVKLADNLPYIIEINQNGHKTVITHADYPFSQYGGEVDLEDAYWLVWSRQRIETLKRTQECIPISGADLFVCGHTPVRAPLNVANCLWIDTGAVFGKELSIVELTKGVA